MTPANVVTELIKDIANIPVQANNLTFFIFPPPFYFNLCYINGIISPIPST